MTGTLVDSNVLLDLLQEDPVWFQWSAAALEAAVPAVDFQRAPLPWEAAFLAGKCFLDYRRRGGGCSTVLPDLFIGAHAAVEGLDLLTRDAWRYRSYFPTLEGAGTLKSPRVGRVALLPGMDRGRELYLAMAIQIA